MFNTRGWRFAVLAAALGAWLLADRAAAQKDSFPFVILGDRTGEAQPGVYERVWRAAAAENPAFAVSVGDSIEGLNDATAEGRVAAAGANTDALSSDPAVSGSWKSRHLVGAIAGGV